MKRLKWPWDWGDLAVLILTVIAYVPWAIFAGIVLSEFVKKFLP